MRVVVAGRRALRRIILAERRLGYFPPPANGLLPPLPPNSCSGGLFFANAVARPPISVGVAYSRLVAARGRHTYVPGQYAAFTSRKAAQASGL